MPFKKSAALHPGQDDEIFVFFKGNLKLNLLLNLIVYMRKGNVSICIQRPMQLGIVILAL